MQKAVYEFISKQTNDPIVEWKICKVSGKSFAIFQSDLEMLDRLSPVIGGKKYPLPVPTLCPEERQRTKMWFDNITNLYKRKCDFTGNMVVSRYSPDKPMKIYEQKIWWSDQRNPMDHGRDFDPNQSFFAQIKQLYYNVPTYSVTSNFLLNQNSEYTNYAGSNKNCYFLFGADYNEDCYYDILIKWCKNCINNFSITNSQQCYQCTDVYNGFALFFSRNCRDCQNSWFLENCFNCEFCIACKNLVNQKYCIFNKQYSREEYEKFVQDNLNGSMQKLTALKNKFDAFILTLPNKALITYHAERSIGNFLSNTKNLVVGFDVQDMENGRYCYQINSWTNKNCMDVNSFGINMEKIYNSGSIGYNAYNIRCSNQVNENCSDIFYSSDIFSCKNLFGCVGLRNKEYCIFNKQYTRNEYEKEIIRIIGKMQEAGEWWEFFPITFSSFAYNETFANNYFPLKKEEAIARWLSRMDAKPEINIPKNMQSIAVWQLPDNIKDVGEDILDKIILCEKTWRPFRLQKGEYEFYKKYLLPIPRVHPDVRFQERFEERPERNLYLRTCDKCWIEMLSVYSKESKFKVYCESCYNKEMYG